MIQTDGCWLELDHIADLQPGTITPSDIPSIAPLRRTTDCLFVYASGVNSARLSLPMWLLL